MKTSVFNYITGISAFLSTLIWLFFLFWGSQLMWNNMEEFLELHKNPLMIVKTIISMACFLFAIIANIGLYIRIKDQYYGLPIVALCFFVLAIAIDFVYRSIESITVHFIWAKNYFGAVDESLKSEYLFKINLFNELSAGIVIVLGIFFAVSRLLFGVCTWKVHKTLSLSFLLAGIFNILAYSAEYLPFSIPGSSWIFYEILLIFLYTNLGIWLIKNTIFQKECNYDKKKSNL